MRGRRTLLRGSGSLASCGVGAADHHLGQLAQVVVPKVDGFLHPEAIAVGIHAVQADVCLHLVREGEVLEDGLRTVVAFHDDEPQPSVGGAPGPQAERLRRSCKSDWSQACLYKRPSSTRFKSSWSFMMRRSNAQPGCQKAQAHPLER